MNNNKSKNGYEQFKDDFKKWQKRYYKSLPFRIILALLTIIVGFMIGYLFTLL